MTTHPALTLADVAVLARVQRPVVSMWRRRPHAQAGAFPAAVVRVGGVDRFDRDEVVAWLVASGRGNNPDVATDAALQMRPPVPTPDGQALVESLALVRIGTGESLAGLDREDLLDLADEVDPDNRCLYSEIEDAAERDLFAVAEYVDALVDAAFGPADVFAHVRRDPSRFGLRPPEHAVSPHVTRLVGQLVYAISTFRGAGAAPWVADPTGYSSGIVLAALEAARGVAVHALSRPAAAGDDVHTARAIRAAWRSLIASGTTPEPIEVDAEGHVDVADGPLVVGCYPQPDGAASPAEKLLTAVDDVLVQLGNSQCAVVLGPASVFTDALDDRGAAAVRRSILDAGRLRALVRFGRGSSVTAPQRRWALWVIGPAPAGNFRGEGRTAVADLAGLDLVEVADDLVADIVAAIEDRPVAGLGGLDEAEGRAHTYRVARYQRTFSVLARDGDLVPRDLHRMPTAPPADAAKALALASEVASSVGNVHAPVVAASTAAATGGVSTVRELLDAGRLRLLGGTKLTRDEWRAVDEVRDGPPVVGVPELVGQRSPGGRVVRFLEFVYAHPRAARTQPGDVVFCAGTNAAAWVDQRGGSVVEAPARILRVTDESEDTSGLRVLPHVLAADLVRGDGVAWRALPARLVPAEVAVPLVRTLSEIAQARDEAQRRVRDLSRLTDLLADGIVDGRLDMMETTETEGH